MLVHGTRNKLPRPDDEHLIWYGDLRWRHSDEHDETKGDASRLQLSALDDSVPRMFADLAAQVHRALVNLQQKHAFHVNAGIAQVEIDAAISSMKDLHTDLGHMVEEWNTSQRDDEASGL